MAINPINPLIPLQVRGADMGEAFSNALLNVGRIDQLRQSQQEAPIRQRLLEAQTQQQEAAVPTEQERVFRSVVNAAVDINRLPTDEDKLAFAQNRRLQLFEKAKETGIPANTEDTDLYISKLESGDSAGAQQLLDQTINAGRQVGIIGQTGGATGLASAKTDILESGATIQALPTGETVVRDPSGQIVTGQERLDVLAQAKEQKLQLKREQAEISVEAESLKERAKLKERRISEITAEISTRNRDAARSERTVNKALTLAQQASQGLKGSSILALSRLIPGIDATDEAALDAATKELALEQLQAFKGPTTDFEFGVTQSIAGGLGQSKAANISRLKSLKRATWFNQREEEQFRKHTKSGGDPDSFRFNFGEPVRTKKGVFTLQDIQDTAVQNNMTIDETIKSLNR
jgi:hypothetical protein